MVTVEASHNHAAVDQSGTAMVVVGESAGDKRKREQIAESETSSVTGDIEVRDGEKTPRVEDAEAPTSVHPETAQPVVASAPPQAFSSHGSLRKHLVEESKKRAEQRRQLRAQRSAPYSSLTTSLDGICLQLPSWASHAHGGIAADTRILVTISINNVYSLPCSADTRVGMSLIVVSCEPFAIMSQALEKKHFPQLFFQCMT